MPLNTDGFTLQLGFCHVLTYSCYGLNWAKDLSLGTESNLGHGPLLNKLSRLIGCLTFIVNTTAILQFFVDIGHLMLLIINTAPMLQYFVDYDSSHMKSSCSARGPLSMVLHRLNRKAVSFAVNVII